MYYTCYGLLFIVVASNTLIILISFDGENREGEREERKRWERKESERGEREEQMRERGK